MRVTVLTIGSRGDVEPFLALGEGLTRAGSPVRGWCWRTIPTSHMFASRRTPRNVCKDW
ncbi:glycosyltransferase [Pseudonocardia sp. GCM10023141]|uniref:glycosyltransferase n=1 Tax=Pseudonocardia sp. GCM10023141 TaxID=3252653 RepID=UPI00360DF182